MRMVFSDFDWKGHPSGCVPRLALGVASPVKYLVPPAAAATHGIVVLELFGGNDLSVGA